MLDALSESVGAASAPAKPVRFALIVLMAALFLSGCGVAEMNSVQSVTPLPRVDPVATPGNSIAATAAPNATPEQTTAIDTPSSVASVSTSETSLASTGSPVPLRFDEFYDGYNIRTGLILSDKLRSLDGAQVVIEGYMAPPLKPALDFFVLTRVRLAFCPFCTTAADWPDDIALVYLVNDTMMTTTQPLRLTGRLELGPKVDAETGMVSIVRIYADSWEIL